MDGAHIRTLLLTFLFRFARELFVQGHVYVGMPPLYKLVAGRQSQYCHDDQQLQERIKGLSPNSYSIQRFKVTCSAPRCTRIHLTLNPKP